MKPTWPLLVVALLSAVGACARPHAVSTAQIVQEGLIDCFDPATQQQEAEIICCEASAVATVGQDLIIASDRLIPQAGASSFLTLSFQSSLEEKNFSVQNYLTATPFHAVRKVEAMTTTPDRQFVLATTACDRPETNYNQLLYWSAADPGEVRALSQDLRPVMQQALVSPTYPDGPPYFKVEGLAAIPEGRLLWGVRAVGADYRHPDFVAIVLETAYSIGAKGLEITTPFKKVYEFKPGEVIAGYNTLALSSIEYDDQREQLYFLTSYEEVEQGKGQGAFLWTVSLTDFRAQKTPALVKLASGAPLHFNHKAEGMALIGPDQLFVIHDDDRALLNRQAHQAPYSLVKLQ